MNFSPAEAVCRSLKPMSNPISGTGLVPIGILVSSTAPTKPRSHRGHVCVFNSQVNHPSNMPRLRNRTELETCIQRGLNGKWCHAHPRPYDQSVRPAYTSVYLQKIHKQRKIQTPKQQVQNTIEVRPAAVPRNNSIGPLHQGVRQTK